MGQSALRLTRSRLGKRRRIEELVRTCEVCGIVRFGARQVRVQGQAHFPTLEFANVFGPSSQLFLGAALRLGAAVDGADAGHPGSEFFGQASCIAKGMIV
eukprot:CAMPEP_0172534854 /NCGR_PEP_ID=MMETSP1067-20121228/7080_1 /TAXON_ID=265564 ORGANISM="Thalassiosira punctigera, Strain Tpunct2005C2" /NCGR_SAMPLE_ID=MMETSP1067 /ASSEMBLY_ACC=CAM_ASM_000444 /LENGTH=99 /DNA_ID=CAMNT_0013319703 /DNA_START=84 /DNA_END=383 /DNA_ORIENTATION=+